MTGFLPHLVSASELPWERKPSEICVEICKKREKTYPTSL